MAVRGSYQGVFVPLRGREVASCVRGREGTVYHALCGNASDMQSASLCGPFHEALVFQLTLGLGHGMGDAPFTSLPSFSLMLYAMRKTPGMGLEPFAHGHIITTVAGAAVRHR